MARTGAAAGTDATGHKAFLTVVADGIGDTKKDPVWMSFTGIRTILVKGAATGYLYRFSPGNWLRVHGDDVASMREFPGLRWRGVRV